jgi:hypothetical protein
MKIKDLFLSCHDVYEKKRAWLKPQIENQLIDFGPKHPSIEHRRVLDDPMIRWPGVPIIMVLSRCTRKIKKLAVSRQILVKS